MNKTIGIVFIVLIVIAALVYFIGFRKSTSETPGLDNNENTETTEALKGDRVPELTANSWQWVETHYDEGDETFTPKKPEKFVATFGDDMRFSSLTDCNNLMTDYTASIKEETLKFNPLASTLMYCEDSEESNYSEMLATVKGYELTSDGDLNLMIDNGIMVFSPVEKTNPNPAETSSETTE